MNNGRRKTLANLVKEVDDFRQEIEKLHQAVDEAITALKQAVEHLENAINEIESLPEIDVPDMPDLTEVQSYLEQAGE